MKKKLLCILGFLLFFVLIKPVFASGSGIITFKYDDFANPGLIKLDGTDGYARIIHDSSTGKDVIRLTPADSITAVRGTAYYKNYVSLANDRSFSTYFTFKIIPIGEGADGIVFILNNDTNELGGGGGGMGYANMDNSIGIEFDTYDNSYNWGGGTPSNTYGDDGLGNGRYGFSHMAVNVNGDIDKPVATASNTQIADYTGEPCNFKNGQLHHVWIDYDGPNSTIEVRISKDINRPDEALITYDDLDLNNILKQDEVYVGFSASTGGSKESHDIYQWYFNNDFTPIDTADKTYVSAPSVSLTATPVTDIETTLTAVLTNADGSLSPNEQVAFSTNLGTLSDTSATTNEDGEASVTLINDTNGGAYVKAAAAYGAYDEVIMPPNVPTLEVSTTTSITLSPIVDAEYKMDDGEWQDSNHFSDLSMNTEYTFYARMKETPTSAASIETTGVTFATLPYTVTYKGNGNTGGTAPNDSSQYEYGATVTVLGQGDLERAGYTFSGWATNADGTGTTYKEDDTFSMGSGNINLWAKWIINGYTVTFLDHDGTQLKTETVAHGNSATAPDAPTREGYTFTGWDKAYDNVISDLEVTVQYNINEYKVSFASTGGSAVDFIKADYGTTITEPTVPSKEGYTFGGWYKEAGLINRWNFESDTIPAEDISLYAKWDTVDYSITYNLDGGANNGINPSSYTIETDTITLCTPTRTGYTFLGWYDAQTDGNKISDIVKGSTGDKTLWARWISNESLWISVNPDIVAGSINFSQEFELALNNDTVAGTVYASDITLGGVFAGLDISAVDNTSTTVTAEVYGNLNSEGTGTITLNGSRLKISTNALASEVTVGLNKVTYDSNESTGGSVPTDNNKYAQEASVTVLGNIGGLEKRGYSFDGWNTKSDGSGYSYKADDVFSMGANNVNLYAIWKPAIVTRHRPSSRGSSNTPSAEILINGKTEAAATSSTKTVDDKTVTTVALDDRIVEEKLQNEGNNAMVTIPVKNTSDIVIGQLNAQTVKNMEEKEGALEIKTWNVTYTIPASQINIDKVSEQIGREVALDDILVNIEISVPPDETVEIIEDTSNAGGFMLVAEPVGFEINCRYGDRAVEVSRFNSYVERTIAIPEGADTSKITTAVVLNPDGSFSHVPTAIVEIEGKYYAKINSLTNSIYSVIYNPKIFKDVENHWAKDAVNDMGSRLVISGVGKDRFEPDRNITRAEFTVVVVRALGLMQYETGEDVFNDVPNNAWYHDAVSAAYEYGIITGYGDGRFDPNDKITREQAFTMISRAMNITRQKVEFPSGEVEKLLAGFRDSDKSAAYAKNSIASCIKSGIVSGRNGNLIAPTDNITRAETAVMVRRLLQKSNLI